ncbi:MAG: acyl-CoA dehydratase activase [Planctomycetota bacterium]|jgi:predicted CoA-substrate-specific enzyme activase
MNTKFDQSDFQNRKTVDETVTESCGSEKIRVLGLCLGASTVSVTQVEGMRSKDGEGEAKVQGRPQVVGHSLHPHDGDPKRTLLSALEGLDLKSFDRIVATGRRFRQFVNLTSISEPEAVEYAYRFVKPPDVSCPAVVSAGGETFMVYVLNRLGRISNVLTGNKCASGTGEFFLQQLRRMDVSLEEADRWAAAEEPHRVSGRCSVFCKSDCTHATNKGVPKSKVTAGLCKMMADKILELLKKVKRQNIMITGGSARNQMMIHYLRKEIPGLIIPDEAPYFEALGAALWGLENRAAPLSETSALFKTEATSFDILPALGNFNHRVDFKTTEKGSIQTADVCVLGLDVGSTTTKAVLLRKSDNALLASDYLRTNGDPVGASRQCYQSILGQIKKAVDPEDIFIEGLGVCGSGRQIAGLHALTEGVINEIIAHATAAVYFDPDVDTLFEIGGQDAKYTYITNGVPSDYTMNEACSAGTGSFLEESAFESLGVNMEDIADVALEAQHPPNFNDQCAAFIASDIKNAIHEGIQHEDIVAGLVYSICMNYSNRVKGNRPVGQKVFMQGGVCYNRAVPLAMASLVGKPIIVPPEPGLMGAFGVALAVKKRIETGLMAKKRFDLQVLANRVVKHEKPFRCKGGRQKCDRRCSIDRIELEGKKYPFGGACNKYYNLRHKIKFDAEKLDLVRIRQRLIFEKYGRIKRSKPDPGSLEKNEQKPDRKYKGKIGINRSFLVNTYYPLYATFFTELGFEPVVPEFASQEGIDHKNTAYCYPAELAHGFFHTLLERNDPPEFIFLPHFKAVPVLNGDPGAQVCPLVQGETFYLQTTFREKLDQLRDSGTKVLTPLLDLTHGLFSVAEPLIKTAIQMGANRLDAEMAVKTALNQQQKCLAEMRDIGKKALEELETDPERIAVVVLARPYNGFVDEAHMGIPHKLASRGVLAIPLDFIPFEAGKTKRHMYWGMGQRILNAARIVKNHPQLFSTYITNFSCGPDSFIVGYVRDIMKRKPSLTLELDSHTADAGLETRIEAFLDIVGAYRKLMDAKKIGPNRKTVVPAHTVLEDGIAKVVTSVGETLPMNHPRVTHLLPSMGKLASESMAAVFRGRGFRMVSHPPSDEAVLKLGRANTSCKECLPLILTTGSLLNYIRNHKRDDEVLVYFMPTASGPCRFGQYAIFMEDLIRKLEIPDVALFSLTSENSYGGLGKSVELNAWRAVVVSDVMEDIRSMLLANATNTKAAMKIFDEEWTLIQGVLERGNFSILQKQLEQTAERLSCISLKRAPDTVPKILLTGEIFVRRDALSRQYLMEKLAEKGFAAICSPIAEWIHYSNYLVYNGLTHRKISKMEKLALMVRKTVMARDEKRIKAILTRSGLVQAEPLNVESIIDHGATYISPNMTGEAILTVGSSLSEVASHTCGVIAIGPFGCMPNRVSEAILNTAMHREDKLATEPHNPSLRAILSDMEDLPFLAIESDGSPFPQLISAKLETFCLRAERLNERMLDTNKKNRGMTVNHRGACTQNIEKIHLSTGIHNRGVFADDKTSGSYI